MSTPDAVDAVEQQIAAVMDHAMVLAVAVTHHGDMSDQYAAAQAVTEAACRRLVLVARAEQPCYTEWIDDATDCGLAGAVPLCPSCEARAELEAQ
jgi:hypothetical protein